MTEFSLSQYWYIRNVYTNYLCLAKGTFIWVTWLWLIPCCCFMYLTAFLIWIYLFTVVMLKGQFLRRPQSLYGRFGIDLVSIFVCSIIFCVLEIFPYNMWPKWINIYPFFAVVAFSSVVIWNLITWNSNAKVPDWFDWMLLHTVYLNSSIKCVRTARSDDGNV